MGNLLDIIFWLIYGFRIPSMLHIMQQESYQNDGMFRWIINNPKKAFKRNVTLFLAVLVSYFIFLFGLFTLYNQNYISKEQFINTSYAPTIFSMIIFIVGNIILFIKEHKERKNAKKPLVYTARAKRLIFNNIIAIILLQFIFMQNYSNFYPQEIKDNLSFGSYYINMIEASGDKELENKIEQKHIEAVNYDNDITIRYSTILYAFLTLAMPLNMIIANFIGSPTETYINEKYIKKAYKKLNKKEYKDLIKIGITGSYGKTSTKFILATILGEKYNVLATPGSYNTTMGNVRVIREMLKEEHQVFISEMGARKKGDIREICNFVNPNIGIITSIGEQHLDTFKNIQNIQKTKGELLDGVGAEGAIFLPKDNNYCFELYKKDSHKNKFIFSTTDKASDIYSKDIKVSCEGSTFTVVSSKNGEYTCTTKLLGEHNVQNIIGAIAIAEYLGLSKEEIILGVSKIKPIEHRLQIIPSANGTIVIDDAFNKNPEGSKRAIDVLSKFDGRKIIITPGMVELGEKEKELNKEFGKEMANVLDIVILIGISRSKPIEDGLVENGFNKDNIYIVKDLNEATKKLSEITKQGDVILFENDLPDSYNE